MKTYVIEDAQKGTVKITETREINSVIKPQAITEQIAYTNAQIDKLEAERIELEADLAEINKLI